MPSFKSLVGSVRGSVKRISPVRKKFGGLVQSLNEKTGMGQKIPKKALRRLGRVGKTLRPPRGGVM